MNKETVHSVKEKRKEKKKKEKKSMYINAIQLNTVTKERTNEEDLMNHRKKKRKMRGERSGNIKACMQLKFKFIYFLIVSYKPGTLTVY